MATTLGRQTAPASDDLEALKARIDPSRIPQHIAIIMDGNGRWARERRLPSRLFGHKEGYKTAKKIVHDCPDLGVKALTLYVFSNENWRRPKHEIDGLMALYEQAIKAELPELLENGVRMRFIGRREGLSPSLLREIENAERVTAGNSRLHLNLALNYGGRAELVDAARDLASAVARGEMQPTDITEETLGARMYTSDLPDPDLLVRTAGEMRVSNFLLWGIAYAEIWVTQTYWPDFTTAHLVEAILDFQGRVRKFGAVVNT